MDGPRRKKAGPPTRTGPRSSEQLGARLNYKSKQKLHASQAAPRLCVIATAKLCDRLDWPATVKTKTVSTSPHKRLNERWYASLDDRFDAQNSSGGRHATKLRILMRDRLGDINDVFREGRS